MKASSNIADKVKQTLEPIASSRVASGLNVPL